MAKPERKAQLDIFLYTISDLQLESIGGIEFTHREIDIIACILSGKTAKSIAAFLSISPKTVENHIRNIMLKLGCRTQENIIDFIEKSNKFIAIKKHYDNLLLQSFFEFELKKIANNNVSEPIKCAIVYLPECKEYANFATSFAGHLNLCGIKTGIHVKDSTFINEADFILYLHATGLGNNYSVNNEQELLDDLKKYSIPVFSVFLNKNHSPTLIEASDVPVIEQTNYCLLVFATIKDLLNINLDQQVTDFKKQLDDFVGVVVNIDKKPEPVDEIISTIPYKSNKLTIFGMVALFFGVFIIFAALNIVQKHPLISPRSGFTDKIFVWIRTRDHFESEIAAKYMESFEEEELKLGRLEGNVDTLRFLRARKNFIKLSNILVTTDDKDQQKIQKLVKLVRDKFPLNTRTHEKIQKLFFALAAYYGKINFLTQLLENAEISFWDFKDYYGNTAPMLAAAGNSVQTFKWLANKDALFINHTNVEGNSALILAALNLEPDAKLDTKAKRESIAVLSKIIEYDPASLKSRGHKGCSALLVAGAVGNITAVQYILDFLAPGNPAAQLEILKNERNIDGNNIMMLAAYNGQGPLIEWLHRKGLSMAQRNKYNTTAFMQAASGGNTRAMDIIYKLHAREKDTDLLLEKNDFGQTPLFLAVHDNHINAFQWIMAKLYKNNFHGDSEQVANYIRNVRNADGDSLLHVLINGMSDTNRHGDQFVPNTGLLDILLHYVDVDTHAILENNKQGDTPLMRAAYYGNLSVVKYLIEKCGANPRLLNARGESAIDYAAFGGHGKYFKVIEYLWDLQARREDKSLLEVKRMHSARLFLIAAKHGQRSVVEWLLRADPELIEAHTQDGDNALTLAVKYAHIDIIEFIFAWDKKIAVRLSLEKRSNSVANIIEELILDEKSGKIAQVSLRKYLEQKVGLQVDGNNMKSTKHNDSNYKWRSLEIGIAGLSTSYIQPWSPYYLD